MYVIIHFLSNNTYYIYKTLNDFRLSPSIELLFSFNSIVPKNNLN